MVPTSRSNAFGTFLVVAASLIFALVALVVKKDPLPVTLEVGTRFFVGCLMSLAFMIRYRSECALNWFGPANIRWLLILRGLLTYSFVTLWWAALPMAPLGDCIALIYCSPFLTVIFSRVMLGEEVLAVFPIQAFLATAGVCFIVQPPLLLRALDLDPANSSGAGSYTLVVAAMIVAAIMPVVTNQAKDASWIEVELITNALAVLVLNPFVLCAQQFATGEASWGLPALGAWEVGLIALAALGSSAGFAMQTRGYQIADPGKASMYNYLEIPFAYILQIIGTDSPMSSNSVVGAILVIFACLLGAFAQIRSEKKECTTGEEPLLQEYSEAEKSSISTSTTSKIGSKSSM